ncbi:hypothetical protein DEO72_LG2g2797 [Vigna unguiculata]|uniref:Uncharacterized protein n=1 Tax=Vigna unguiculata TaxID=3917 RepID=A0A4D6L1U6_VIGUN|nr:hypothetical protein DEO72_LG2g2797 [Vigna unguiculata]
MISLMRDRLDRLYKGVYFKGVKGMRNFHGRMGVKHVAFYGLWPGMTFLELCAQDSGRTLETLSCGLGWRVCRCECAGCGQYGWVQMDCPP